MFDFLKPITNFLKPIDLLAPRTIFAIRARLFIYLSICFAFFYFIDDSSNYLLTLTGEFIHQIKPATNDVFVLAAIAVFVISLATLVIFGHFVLSLFGLLFSFSKPDVEHYDLIIEKLRADKTGILFNFIQCVKNQKRDLSYFEAEYIKERFDKILFKLDKGEKVNYNQIAKERFDNFFLAEQQAKATKE